MKSLSLGSVWQVRREWDLTRRNYHIGDGWKLLGTQDWICLQLWSVLLLDLVIAWLVSPHNQTPKHLSLSHCGSCTEKNPETLWVSVHLFWVFFLLFLHQLGKFLYFTYWKQYNDNRIPQVSVLIPVGDSLSSQKHRENVKSVDIWVDLDYI